MRIVVTLSAIAGFAGLPILSAFPAPATNGIWANICSGQAPIWIDFGRKDNDAPQKPIHSKACHAVCCKRDDTPLGHDGADDKLPN